MSAISTLPITSVAQVTQANIAWIGPFSSELSFGANIQVYEQVTDLPANADILILGCPKQQDDILYRLRHQSNTALSLILVTEDSHLSPYLANGRWQQDWQSSIQSYLQRKQLWHLQPDENLELRLLSYLWLHQGNSLSPLKSPASPELYDYPLLTAWGLAKSSQVSWLNSLTQKGWLESRALVNRVRYSPCCHSSRLNYLDSCPSCHNIDIKLQTSLHCFNCGHIGAEESFRQHSGLSCPNCYQTLRHIGVDYDRPIENQHCQHCQTMFVEATVAAQCLECNTSHELSALQVVNFADYSLSLGGQLLARQGVVANLFTDHGGNQMSLSQFCWLANWQNQLAKRHQHSHTILSVTLVNDQMLHNGTMPWQEIDTLQQRICSIVRTTDACTQYTEAGLLFLLPFTQPDNIKALMDKFVTLQNSFSIPLYFEFRNVVLPAESGLNFQSWLMDSLAHASPNGHE